MRTDSSFDPISANLNSDLPSGWVWTTIGELALSPRDDIVDGPFGSNLKASEHVDRGTPIVRLQNIDRNKFIRKNMRFVSTKKAEQLKRHNYSSGDILVTKLGAPLGKACLVPADLADGIIVADVVRIRISHQHISNRYVMYAINSDIGITQLQALTKGTTRPRVNLGHIRALEIPLAPLSEQLCIVKKIEQLFSRLDAGLGDLKQIKRQLGFYRQSMLKFAFEGRSTAAWRKKFQRGVHPSEIGDNGVLDSKRPDGLTLPKLPDGWIWSDIGSISERIHYGYTASASPEPTGTKMLRITDIQNNDVDWTSVPYCRIEEENKHKYFLRAGDLVFARTGATVGKSFLITGTIPEAVFASYLIRISLKRGVDKRFIYAYLQTDEYWSQINKRKAGIGQPNVNARSLSKIPVPLPSLEEQKVIVQYIERHLLHAKNVERAIFKAFIQEERLRQSTLHKAFEGKLAAQDPNDEPASVVLERVRLAQTSKKVASSKVMPKNSRQTELGHYVK